MQSVDHDKLADFPLRRVEILNWVLAALLTVIAAFTTPYFIAKSVFIGGFLANISYLFLKRDLIKFLQGKLLLSGQVRMAKIQFYFKYYVRLGVLAIILYLLVRQGVAHPLGLLVGLSVIVLSITITVTTVIKRFFFTAEEA